MCNGIGLSKGQKDRQTENIKQDMVLKGGCRKFAAGVFDPHNETFALELNFIPLWLAKITITPMMQAEQPEVTERLVKYQLEAKEVLAEAFLSKATRRKPKDISVKQHLNIANSLVQITGVKKEIAYAVAIEEAEKETGEDLTAYKKLLPSAEHETGFLTPTLIGQHISMKAQTVNLLLEKLMLQYKDEKKAWRLTEQGKTFGEEFPYKRNNHTGYQIRWNESVLSVLRETVA